MATKALETMRKAVTLKKNSIKWYTELQSAVRAEIKQIEQNNDYTISAKSRMIGELKQKRGIEIMQLIGKRKQAYLWLLNKAKKQAEDVIYDKLKKPSEEKIERFNTDLKHVKTKLMLAKTGDEVKNILKSFIEKIEMSGNDRAYFATEFANQFDEIITTALNIDSSDKMKHELKQMYERLYYELQTDEIKEAREVLDTVNELLKKPTLFVVGPLIEQNTNYLFGKLFTHYINEPEEFFNQPGYTEYKRNYSDVDLEAYVEKELKAVDE